MKFDRLAPHYDWLEALTAGSRLQRTRVHWLEALRGRRRILSPGEGHGRFAAECAARWPDAELTCVEASAGMLQRARRRAHSATARIRWINADVLSWPPAEKYDAIATCFFLDCFPPPMLAEVIAKLAGCAEDKAVWLVADFAIPQTTAARWRACCVHRLMYTFFRATIDLPARKLTAPDELLRAHGFYLAGRQEFDWRLLRADLWQRGS